MLSLKQELTQIFTNAFVASGLHPGFGEVSLSQRPELGHFQCNGALPGAKAKGQKPRELAQAAVAEVGDGGGLLESVQIDGPGFINIRVRDSVLANRTSQLDHVAEGAKTLLPNKTPTLIDFAGPNIAKPMHVGHLRSTIIGDCLARLMRYLDVPTVTVNHLGDWGTPMGMLIEAVKKKRGDLPYFNAERRGGFGDESPVTVRDLESMYPLAASLCKSDASEMKKAQGAVAELQSGRMGYVALWQHFVDVSKAQLEKEFLKLGVHFDFWRGESYYHPHIGPLLDRLKDRGIAIRSEGAWVIPLAKSGSGTDAPPFLLVKTDGAYLYGTTDLTALHLRVQEFGLGRLLYVVDNRQSLHFSQLFEAAKLAGLAPNAEMIHVGFGTVNGKDGKPFKTREGGVMRLEALLETVIEKARERMKTAGLAEGYPEEEQVEIANLVGLAALKYADLVNHRETNYIFDLESFTQFEGKTGPYLLYSAVRIKSILRKARERGFPVGDLLILSELERGLSLSLLSFPDVLVAVAGNYLPSYLAEYIYEVAQKFNQFYSSCHILTEPDETVRGARLRICQQTLLVMEQALRILGIEIPERM